MEITVRGKLQGKHVLYMLLGFFGVTMSVNALFVYLAATSFSGLSVQDSYKRGINYNSVIASAESQVSRGWQVNFGFEALGGKRGALSLNLADKYGNKIPGLEAVANLQRPLGQYKELSQRMVMTRDGFETEIEFEAAGQWDLIVQLTGGGFEQPYRLEKRVWVK